MGERRVLLEGGEGEITEKKSRFIATLRPVSSEEEAGEFFAAMKKKYWDARHNCSAFVIGEDPPRTRCSDDGEPSGTAGRPMLEVLTGSGLVNAAVVVTRYFGGTLLGTGGLVRAYTAAVQEGLKNCVTGIEKDGCRLGLKFPYADESRVRNILRDRGCEPENSEYASDVYFECVIDKEKTDEFITKLTDGCGGRAAIEKLGDTVFLDKQFQ
ncbi:MAG: YigZ family protein [Lachnospiraceae bacterium]|nr:YigZ family protein [Lachnospiraceae bacterium]